MPGEQKQIVETRESEPQTPKYKSFDREKLVLLLGLDISKVDLESLKGKAAENGLEPRRELHITVIGYKNAGSIRNLLSSFSETKRRNILFSIKTLIAKTDWSFVLAPEKYHVSKTYSNPNPVASNGFQAERREAYIQLIRLPALRKFYEQLNAILGANLELPFPHVTLYTGGDDRQKAKMGIGINSEEEFHKLEPESI